MLILGRKEGEAILIEGGIRVVVVSCDRGGVRLGVAGKIHDPADVQRVLDGGVDITSVSTVPASQRSIVTFGARAAGCLAGLDIACAVVEIVCGADNVTIERVKSDGDRLQKGDVIECFEVETIQRAL